MILTEEQVRNIASYYPESSTVRMLCDSHKEIQEYAVKELQAAADLHSADEAEIEHLRKRLGDVESTPNGERLGRSTRRQKYFMALVFFGCIAVFPLVWVAMRWF